MATSHCQPHFEGGCHKMKQLWTADKLGESWTLSHDDFVLARNHLGFAFQLYAKFVDGFREMAFV